MYRCTPTMLPLLLAVAAQPAWSEDFHAGQFVQEKCTGCHDSTVYTRSKRKVDSLLLLKGQVQMCDAQLGIRLFNEELDAVVNYLNDNYYRFDQ